MTPDRKHPPQALGTAYEQHAVNMAKLLAGVVLIGGILLSFATRQAGLTLWLSLAACVVCAGLAYWLSLRKVRRRRELLSRPFPSAWEAVLQKDVAFFRALQPGEQRRFRAELVTFLGEKRITGIRTELDTRTRVLVGASAIIPIFGFPEWEWDQISEVLVYPSRFDENFDLEGGDGQHILGMVGTGAMNRIMILVKPDLIAGFTNPGDKRNVGIHEFAHLVDKSDGAVDGVPRVGLPPDAIAPWIELVRRKMREIDDGASDLNRYALTNEAEFFSVAAEYFFERPGIMERKHPELFAMLQKVFLQDMKSRARALRREISSRRKSFGRNSPCPCGSGKKYKNCCLGR